MRNFLVSYLSILDTFWIVFGPFKKPDDDTLRLYAVVSNYAILNHLSTLSPHTAERQLEKPCHLPHCHIAVLIHTGVKPQVLMLAINKHN